MTIVDALHSRRPAVADTGQYPQDILQEAASDLSVGVAEHEGVGHPIEFLYRQVARIIERRHYVVACHIAVQQLVEGADRTVEIFDRRFRTLECFYQMSGRTGPIPRVGYLPVV